MTPKYEAIMASVWTGDLSQGTRCEVARCASPELAQRLAERLNTIERLEKALGIACREWAEHCDLHLNENYKHWREVKELMESPAPTPSLNR